MFARVLEKESSVLPLGLQIWRTPLLDISTGALQDARAALDGVCYRK